MKSVAAIPRCFPAHPLARRADGGRGAPRGFTIVELLVVVGIIAVLATMITPAVIRARSAARNAAIDAEIDLLHMALMNYRNEYGSFPPCLSGTLANDPAARHIKRVFPRTTNPAFEVRGEIMHPIIGLACWLGGYTRDPTCPVTGTNAGGPRRKLYDFDPSRLDTKGLVYFPVGRSRSPFIYFNAASYTTNGVPTGPITVWPTTAYTYTVGPTENPSTVTIAANTYSPVLRVTGEYFNPDTFQILCAGQDGVWGNDDDLSNFWNGTRAQHAARGQ